MQLLCVVLCDSSVSFSGARGPCHRCKCGKLVLVPPLAIASALRPSPSEGGWRWRPYPKP
eukprot:12257420-Alexandrium_andersonii.AAC.1